MTHASTDHARTDHARADSPLELVRRQLVQAVAVGRAAAHAHAHAGAFKKSRWISTLGYLRWGVTYNRWHDKYYYNWETDEQQDREKWHAASNWQQDEAGLWQSRQVLPFRAWWLSPANPWYAGSDSNSSQSSPALEKILPAGALCTLERSYYDATPLARLLAAVSAAKWHRRA